MAKQTKRFGFLGMEAAGIELRTADWQNTDEQRDPSTACVDCGKYGAHECPPPKGG